MRRKVFYLSTSLNIGGTEKYLLTLIESFGSEYDFVVGYFKEKGYIGQVIERKGIPVIKFDGLFDLIKYLKKNKFDLMQTFLYRANILGRIAGKYAGVPVIVSTQQAVDDWKYFYHSWIDGYTAQWCSKIIANSRTAKAVLIEREQIDPEKIEVIYNGLDLDAFKPGKTKEQIRKELNIPQDVPVIAYVGRLHKEKGTDYLPEIADNIKNAVFIVVGDGPEKNDLTTKATNNFKFLGWRQDIADLLGASDILIMPSREESFPQVILEAMSCSLPVVAYDVGGVKELIEDNTNGIIVSSGNIKEFSEAVKTLINKKDEAKRLGENGKVKSLGFSKSLMIEKTKVLYNNLLNTN
jgi:glycosyltransferase involved in cell wall biosynthesis